ncbi:MAG: arylsulfatase [Verrucomicrobiales bacterium]
MAVCSLALALAITAAGTTEPAKPNILLILADDLGFSDLGCYGGEIDTPHLDGLAHGGLRFTQAYNTARCWPSRAALLTGYYAQQVRRDALPDVPGGGQGQRPSWAPLLPRLLKPAGYRAYHSGKWHVDGDVLAGGFDRSLHTKNDGNYFTASGNLLDDRPITRAADESGYYTTIATADHAIECLRDHAAHHADRPFFQYIAFIAPHFPLHALPDDIARYRDRYLDGWEKMRADRFARQQAMGLVNTALSAVEPDIGPPYAFPDALVKLGPGEVNRPLPWASLTEAQHRFQATKMAIHAAMVDRMDREIGRVVDQLKRMNAFENTLILFASDNGASAEIMVRHGGHDSTAPLGSATTYPCLGPGFSNACNTPFRRHKTWVHEGGISTPFIVHWPVGITTAGALRHTPVHLIDIVPTVLELSDQIAASFPPSPAPPRPGLSLRPVFAADTSLARPHPLWWLHDGHRALRDGDLKLVAARDQPWELYNLATDRAEAHNLAAQRPETVAQMASRWQAMTDAMAALRGTQPSTTAPK